MTIVQLEYLLAVADYGSFSVASEHCFVTQPSLSTQIKNLEEELGVILLDRSEKPMALTEAGRVVVEKARNAVSEFYKVAESIKEMRNEVKGSLRLAVIPTIAPYLLHRFIPDFIRRYPEVNLEIKEMFTRDIVTALKHDAVDIAVLAGGFTDPKEIREEVLFDDEFYLYASQKHRLYGQSAVTVGDIDVSHLLLLADGHCLRTQVLDLCNSRNQKTYNMAFESGSLETIMRIVDTSDTITIIPAMAAAMVADSHRDQLRPFVDGEAFRHISLAVSRTFFKRKIYEALKQSILDNLPEGEKRFINNIEK